MTPLDKEVKKKSMLDHNDDHFYDCFEETKPIDVLQLMSKYDLLFFLIYFF